MKRITIEDVAKAAGVSRQTVSRAMNNKGEISPATKERVMQAIEELGYMPNRIAQGMVTRSTRTIGLVIGDITNLFFAEVARGVQDLAQAHDYHVILYNTDDDHAGELRALRSLTAQGVDGIIGFFYNISDDELISFSDPNRAIVIINRAIEQQEIGTLVVDNQQGAKFAVEHLVQRGHKRIGMLSHSSHPLENVRRVKGYQDALTEAGLEHSLEYIARGHPTIEGGYQATMELLTAIPNITALFAYNDLMALGAIQASKELERTIPDQLAVVGYDDIIFSALANPALTTVRVDKYKIGQRAMQCFLNIHNEQLQPIDDILIDVELIIRDSS